MPLFFISLREMFPGHLISLHGDISWPTYSTDLNPCDFFLWGYLMSKVHINHPHSIEQLEDAIHEEITAIPYEMTCQVIDNFCERLQQCVDNNESHLTDLFLKPNETKWHYMYFSKIKTFFYFFTLFGFY